MKSDYLKECLSEVTQKAKSAIPIDQFMSEYCVYCLNNTCSRSGSSNMAFERRAKNWESNLFLNVPRASDTDPNYDPIRSKWYISPRVELHTPVVTTTVKENKPPVKSPAVAKPKIPAKKLSPKKTGAKGATKKNVKESLSKTKEEVLTVQSPSEPSSVEESVPSVSPGPKANTDWDSPGYVGDSESSDIVIKPGESFTFG